MTPDALPNESKVIEREEMRAQWAQELADALNPDTGDDA